MVKVGQWYQITILRKKILYYLTLGTLWLILTLYLVYSDFFSYFAKIGQRSLSALKPKSKQRHYIVKTTPCRAQILLIFALRATV